MYKTLFLKKKTLKTTQITREVKYNTFIKKLPFFINTPYNYKIINTILKMYWAYFLAATSKT